MTPQDAWHADDAGEWLRQSWETLREKTCGRVGELCGPIVREMEARRGRDEMSAWLLYNAGFLVQTPGHRFGIDLSFPAELRESGAYSLAGLDSLELLLVSHRHRDHCFPELVETVAGANPDLRVMAPAEAADELVAGGVERRRIRIVTAGDTVELNGLTVEAMAGDHRKENIAENVVYRVTADGFRLVHTGDNRDFGLTFFKDADLLCLDVYGQPEDGRPFSWALADMEAIAQEIARMRPRQVVLCHLNEIGHLMNEAWRWMHAGIVQERLWLLDPEIVCHAGVPGGRVTRERDRAGG